MVRTFHHEDFEVDDLVAAKGSQTISVCLPARDEEATIEPIVASIIRELRQRVPLVDELVVIDDHSTDRTAHLASRAGAEVVAAGDVLAEYGDGHGKGEALWKSLHVTKGDLVIWCDADIVDFSPSFVTGLAGALLLHREVCLAKAFYERPLHAGEGGGRVTELVARPALSLLFPELTPIVQPLAGEYGGRREALEQLPFVEGYGVDLALLIDAARTFGVGALAQVDLGERYHRNRPLSELGPQALAVLHAVLGRAEPSLVSDLAHLVRPGRAPVEHVLAERPPLTTVPAYRRRSA